MKSNKNHMKARHILLNNFSSSNVHLSELGKSESLVAMVEATIYLIMKNDIQYVLQKIP